jgi:short subunit dehydrogenase-like uncharacterized protein
MPDLDLILYGATGFVGRLTARYLAQHAPEGASIGLGGRSQPRLEEVRRELGVDWPLVTADSDDEAALAELAGRTKVVATTVGPYAKYGRKLVAACAAAGTHYADLTGETSFMRETIDAHHDQARGTGARIVHNCGFDSIPSDLGVLLLHRAAAEPLEGTTAAFTVRGGISGGTLDSMRGQLDEARSDKARARTMMDPYALSPDRAKEPELGSERELMRPDHDPVLGWVAPWVMATINTRVVRRSNALQDWAYGREFRYREVMKANPVVGAAITAGLGSLVAGLAFPPTRKVLDRVLPKPGEGPSEKTQANGFFKVEITARGESGRIHRAKVAAQGDPGYAATAVLFGEAALCLALDELPSGGGVLTPATAMGMVLVERLRAAGVTLEVPL